MILISVLLLSGCDKKAGSIVEEPTAAPTAATVPSGTTEPTVALTPYNTPVNVQMMQGSTYGNQAFQIFLNESIWYNRALSCIFEKPEDIPADYFFFGGISQEDIQDNTAFTNEERAYLHSKWCEKYGATPWVDAVKIPVIKLNEALSVFNKTVKDIKFPEDWVYYDKTDAYYAPRKQTGSSGVSDVTVTKIVRNIDTVQIYWKTDNAYTNTTNGKILANGVKMVTTLKKLSFNNGQNSVYVIVSNLPGVYSPLTFAELNTPEDFTAFIQQEWWCWRAMGCTFEKPENISLEHYFYMGLENDESEPYVPLTKEEQERINAAYKAKFGSEPYTDETRLPEKDVKEALSFLGVTLENVKIPDIWLYDDKTVSYYCWKSDAYGLVGWTVTEVVKNTDGTVQVHWESKDSIWNTQTNTSYPDGTKMVMTMQATADGGYLILSNLPAK